MKLRFTFGEKPAFHVHADVLHAAIVNELERLVGPLGAAKFTYGNFSVFQASDLVFEISGETICDSSDLNFFKAACTLTSSVARCPCRVDVLA